MRTLRTALLMLVALTVITGIVYPLVVTAVAQVIFPHAANGSLVEAGGHVVGSRLIGQAFVSPRYFWSRPSATSPYPYNAAASSGSNLGPTNPALLERIGKEVARLRTANPQSTGFVPGDLATASASGLDPEISPAAAYYQVQRVASARGASAESVKRLVAEHVESRGLGFLGEPRVNVLLVNLALDDKFPTH